MVFIVDTHALVWYLSASKKLSSKAKKSLEDTRHSLIFPSIVLAEIKYLYSKHKIKVSFDEIRDIIEKDERCSIYPLDETILEYLPEELDIHDAVICATALALKDALGEEVKIITKDEEIKRSGLVKITW